MAPKIRNNKEIQVQKPAQSLQAFQAKLASGQEPQAALIKPIAIGAGAIVLLASGFFGFRAWRAHRVEVYETALAELSQTLQGTPQTPVSPVELEKRMREALPKLDALAKAAPSSRKAQAEAMAASWRLQLDGKGGAPAILSDPWSRLRAAQRLIALGQGKEALDALKPLQKSADPGEAWSTPFWNALLEARCLQGDRPQALKDYADYKARFKGQADTASMDRILASI